MPYVYRFLDGNGKILYVGQTINLDSRMQTHFEKSGHLKREQYQQVKRVEYIELPTKNDMDVMEHALIAFWMPPFNTEFTKGGKLTIAIKIPGEGEWHEYHKHSGRTPIAQKQAQGNDIKHKSRKITIPTVEELNAEVDFVLSYYEKEIFLNRDQYSKEELRGLFDGYDYLLFQCNCRTIRTKEQWDKAHENVRRYISERKAKKPSTEV